MTARKVLITGASEGIGLAIARKLAGEGYSVTGVARSGDRLRDAMAGLGGPGTHDGIVADIADETARQAVIDAIRATHYDVLINNAGVGRTGAFGGSDVDKQVQVLRLNCEALIVLSHAFLQSARAGDALMNVSSALAFAPMPGLGVYSATKAFVTSFTESLWYEQRPRGVYVVALHPGMTSTDFQIHAGGKKGDLPAQMAQTPEQVADVAASALHTRMQPSVISGGKNAVFTGLTRLLPRKAVVSMMGKTANRM